MDPYDSPLRSLKVVPITHSPHSLLRTRESSGFLFGGFINLADV